MSRRELFRAATMAALGLNLHVVGGCRPGPRAHHAVLGTRTRMVNGLDAESWVATIDIRTGAVSQIPIPMRAHSVVQHATNPDIVVALAQRSQFRDGMAMPLPGTDSCEVSLSEQRVTRIFRCNEGRHFYGHGVYTTDGSVLFTTENNFADGGAGVLTARDATTLQSIGQLPTHGIDPHEIRMIQQGRVAVIANGGERTHPDYPLVVLNPDDRESSISWVDMQSGSLLDQVRLPGTGYSLRHIDADDQGSLAIALQDGEADVDGDNVPVAVRFRGGELRLLSGPPGLAARTGYHALSVALMPNIQRAMVTHPNGHCVTLWDLETGSWVDTIEIPGPTGVALTPDRRSFLISSAMGSLYRADAENPQSWVEIPDPEVDVQWDSHLTNVVLGPGSRPQG